MGAMDYEKLINNRRFVKFLINLVQIFPERLGENFALNLGNYFGTKKDLDFVRNLRANQWVISGENLSSKELDKAVQENISSIARAFFLLFKYHNNRDKLGGLLNLTPQAEKIIRMSQEEREGFIIVTLHTSSFDLMLQSGSYNGLTGLMISLPDVNEALEWQHDLRRDVGTPVLPASFESIRQAVKRLKAGGTVFTGIDRPITGLKTKVRFFGRLASLPVHHIQMALMANVPIVVVASHFQDDGRLRLSISDFIEMEAAATKQERINKNAEKILRIGEKFILEAPHEWAIYFPVWPEILSQTP